MIVILLSQYQENIIERVTFNFSFLFNWSAHFYLYLNELDQWFQSYEQLKDSQNNRKQQKLIPFSAVSQNQYGPDFWLIPQDRNTYRVTKKSCGWRKKLIFSKILIIMIWNSRQIIVRICLITGEDFMQKYCKTWKIWTIAPPPSPFLGFTE